MKEVQGDIWDYHAKGAWVVITTNGTVKRNGEAVMGKGVALEAKKRFPLLPLFLGSEMRLHGLRVEPFPEYRLVCLPVKYNWWIPADYELIERSAHELMDMLNVDEDGPELIHPPVYMVRPGCGAGGLAWLGTAGVRAAIGPILDNRFVVVERKS